MIPFSRRDEIAVQQMISLFHREITVDPEQHNPARRAARRQDIAHARMYFNQRRAADEQRKDDELRAKLDGQCRGAISVLTADLDRCEDR